MKKAAALACCLAVLQGCAGAPPAPATDPFAGIDRAALSARELTAAVVVTENTKNMLAYARGGRSVGEMNWDPEKL
ncbi:MAG: hypothetical protein KGK30_07990, partial [Elusimicrobia bacterium]|nr:hypothetical protein [Elusimicrobiota bacterium]